MINRNQKRTILVKIKLSFFNVAYHVTTKNDQSLVVTSLLSFIQFIQILYFSFQSSTKFAWHNEELFRSIQSILETFSSLTYILKSESPSTYLALMYLGITIILSVILLGFFLSHFHSMQLNHTLNTILSVLIKFLITIGYVEILRLLLELLTCQRNKGPVYQLFNDTTFWTGNFIIHASVAAISIIFLITIAFFGSKLQVTYNPKNSFALKSSQPYQNYFSYIAISLILYTLIKNQIMIVLVIQMAAGFWFFVNIYYEKPFYTCITQRIWSVISGIVFYTNFVLWVTYCFENKVFKDTMIGWLISTPLLALILMKDHTQALDIFKINLNQDISGTEIIEKCKFLLHLTESYEKNQKNEILLSGFFEIHKQFCKKSNCAINVNENLAKKFPENPKYRDKKLIITDLVNQFYQEGLARLNKNVNLRIHYAQFLFDYMEQSNKAISELDFAKEFNPSFEQQFSIFMLKKVIEDQSLKNSSVNGLQRVLANNKSLTLKYKELSQLIEECSLLHLQFWNQLLEEVPNLQYLNQSGRKIILLKEKVKKQCAQMQQIGKLGIKSQRLILKFFQNVCHEDYDINESLVNNFKNQDFDYYKFMQDQEDLSSYSFPVLILEIFSDTKQSTIIKNANLGILALLGFSKADLIGRSLSLIMPEMYEINVFSFLRIHHTVVKTYFCSKHKDQVVHNAKERQIFLKSKSNYVIPIQTTNFVFATEKGHFKFCRIRYDFNYHNSGYILFDLNGYVENISSACITLLHLNEKVIQLKQLVINQLFPTLLSNKQQYLDRMSPIEFYYQSRSMNKSLDFEDRPINAPIQCLVQLFELNNQHFQNNGPQSRGNIVGYVLKVELPQENNLGISRKKINNNIFQFRYNLEEKIYKMEAISPTASQNDSNKLLSNSFEEAQVVTFQSLKNRKQFSMITVSTRKPNTLGFDIKIMRLFQSQLIEISDIQEEEESEIKELTKMQLEDDHEEQIQQTIKVKNKQDLRELIQQSKVPQSIKSAILYSNLFMLGLFCVTVIMYAVVGNTQTQFKNALILLSTNNLRYGSILKIQSNLQDLRSCNLNFEPMAQIAKAGLFVSVNRVEMAKELNSLILSHNLLAQSQIEIDQEHLSIIDEFQNSNIEVVSRNGAIQYFQYQELILQMISKAISLNNSSPDVFASDNDDYFFYLYNSFNSIPLYQSISQNYYYANILSLINKLHQNEDIFYFSSLGFVLLIFLSLQYYIYIHSNCISDTLSQFLDISEGQVRTYSEKVSQFIQSMQFDEDDDINEAEKVHNQDFDVDFLTRKKRKSFQYSIQDLGKTQVNLIMFLTLIIAYQSYIFFTSNDIIDQNISLIPLVNITSYFPAYYRLIDNGLKEMFFNSSSTISYQPNTIDLLDQFIEFGYDLHADLHIMNQVNQNILLNTYKNTFYQIYLENACTIIILIDSTIDQKGCESFNRNILMSGLSIAITNFLENARYLLKQYQEYNPSIQYDLTFNISSDSKVNFTENLLNSYTEFANRKLQKVFIRACHIHLIDKLEEYLNEHYDELQIQLVALFLTCCIISFIFYFLMWIPWLKYQHGQIFKSRELLQIIPIQCFETFTSLQQFIQKINTHG